MEKDYKKDLEFLAKDEEEAIEGYDKVIEKLGDNPIVKQLKKIRDEEKAHLDFLKKAQEDEDAEYEDPSDSEPEEEEEEDEEDETEKRKMASILFKINL